MGLFVERFRNKQQCYYRRINGVLVYWKWCVCVCERFSLILQRACGNLMIFTKNELINVLLYWYPLTKSLTFHYSL